MKVVFYVKGLFSQFWFENGNHEAFQASNEWNSVNSDVGVDMIHDIFHIGCTLNNFMVNYFRV